MPKKERTQHIIEQQKAYRLKNKEAIKANEKEYRKNNKEFLSKRHKRWYKKNKKKVYLYQKSYRGNNKEKVRRWQKTYYEKYGQEYSKNYHRERCRRDSNYRLKCRVRTRIWNVLKGKDKSASTMELIGCTIEELWVHLESSPKWELWMTRENYGRSGGWDVDHIKACANFNLTDPEQQRICCNWRNLQPMEHIANIKKGAKIISGDITSPKM